MTRIHGTHNTSAKQHAHPFQLRASRQSAATPAPKRCKTIVTTFRDLDELEAYLARVVVDADKESMAIRAAGGPLVKALDNDGLAASVAAVEDHHDLVGLQRREG